MANYRNYINTGIASVRRVSRGSHICHFFKDREGLTGVIVPFIKVGLADNEKCILVTSDILGNDEAYKELNKKGTSVDDYIDKGQLIIADYKSWYTGQGRLDIAAVLNRWIEAGNLALDKGYSGLRAVGIIPRLFHEYWDNLLHYETAVDSVIRKLKMVALCSYQLDNMRIDKVIEVVSNHGLVFIQHANELIAIGNSRLAKVRLMKDKGLSYTAIGNEIGVTRQRVHQILNRQKKLKKKPNQMLTISQVAALLNMHINTIRHWSDLGILPTYRIGTRGDRRFKQKDVSKLIRTPARLQ